MKENNFIYKENDVAADVAQRESSRIKRYASAFSIILILRIWEFDDDIPDSLFVKLPGECAFKVTIENPWKQNKCSHRKASGHYFLAPNFQY